MSTCMDFNDTSSVIGIFTKTLQNLAHVLANRDNTANKNNRLNFDSQNKGYVRLYLFDDTPIWIPDRQEV